MRFSQPKRIDSVLGPKKGWAEKMRVGKTQIGLAGWLSGSVRETKERWVVGVWRTILFGEARTPRGKDVAGCPHRPPEPAL
jgi:hypothetical protein